MATMEEVKQRIKNGEDISGLEFDFAVNTIITDTGFDFHDSSNYENEYDQTFKMTLVHIAIESRNTGSLIALLRRSADISIPKVISEKVRQRAKISGDFSGIGKWSKWRDKGVRRSTKTSIQLANLTGSQLIIDIVSNPKKYIGLDDESDNSSTVSGESENSSSNSEFKSCDDSSFDVASLVEDLDNLQVSLASAPGHGNENKIVKHPGHSYYGLPSRVQAIALESRWAQRAADKFFRVGRRMRADGEAMDIYKAIRASIKNGNSVAIDGKCRRSLIIALSKVVSEDEAMPNLRFKLGPTVINFQNDGSNTRRQMANFKMDIEGIFDIAYGAGCEIRVNNLLEASWESSVDKRQRETQFKQLIKQRLASLRTFSHNDFNKYGMIARRYEAKNSDPRNKRVKNNIHFANGLLFLTTVVEVVVRLYRTNVGGIHHYGSQLAVISDKRPIALYQSRALKLLLNNKISFKDFIGQSTKYNDPDYRAQYGVVTSKNTIGNPRLVNDKSSAVNDKYRAEFPLSLHPDDQFEEIYTADNRNACFLFGRNKMKSDLKHAYGSGSESSDEDSDYSDDDNDSTEYHDFVVN